jgi:uncharacterized protein (UPF0548 family)
MIFMQIPNHLKINIFVENQSKFDFTYAAISATKNAGNRVEGFDNDFAESAIGEGEMDFEKAKNDLRAWKMFPSTWTKILPEAQPIEVGVTVAMFARFLGLWWRNACKIVYVIDEPRRFGFAYGTLPGHIERGEELFLIEWRADNRVYYSIKAFSRPRHIFAKIGYPLVRILQERFRQDSMRSMSKSEI